MLHNIVSFLLKKIQLHVWVVLIVFVLGIIVDHQLIQKIQFDSFLPSKLTEWIKEKDNNHLGGNDIFLQSYQDN